MLQINNPILTSVDMLKIKSLNRRGLKTDTVSLDMLCGVKALYPQLIACVKRTVAAA